MKVCAEIETFRPATMVAYASLCGWALARAHAKAGDAAMIAGYLGATDQFNGSLEQFAEDYADQADVITEPFGRECTNRGCGRTEPSCDPTRCGRQEENYQGEQESN